MARGLFSAVPPPPELTNLPPSQNQQSQGGHAPAPSGQQDAAVDIESWVVAAALQSLSVSPLARGTGTPLSIPLDDHVARSGGARFAGDSVVPPPRPRSARDSMKRREALQKGKEGSRQRRRWNNDRLVGVPNAQSPLPYDCVPRPTHPVTHVPYHVAQHWDKSVQKALEDKALRLQAARKKQQLRSGTATGLGVGEVPRDLRESTKRSPVVKGWVRDLEEPVRRFLALHSEPEPSLPKKESPGQAAPSESDSSDEEEMLFVGRKEMKRNPEWRKARREVNNETVEMGIMLQSFGDDESAAFKRWLTHSISDYYGLVSQSVEMGYPAKKVVYVGLKQVNKKAVTTACVAMPRPLWELC